MRFPFLQAITATILCFLLCFSAKAQLFGFGSSGCSGPGCQNPAVSGWMNSYAPAYEYYSPPTSYYSTPAPAVSYATSTNSASFSSREVTGAANAPNYYFSGGVLLTPDGATVRLQDGSPIQERYAKQAAAPSTTTASDSASAETTCSCNCAEDLEAIKGQLNNIENKLPRYDADNSPPEPPMPAPALEPGPDPTFQTDTWVIKTAGSKGSTSLARLAEIEQQRMAQTDTGRLALR